MMNSIRRCLANDPSVTHGPEFYSDVDDNELNVGLIYKSSNSPPTASFTHSGVELACDFDGSGSADSDSSTWSGATSTDVDVLREGGVIATTVNDGAFTDHIHQRGGGSYVYHVCEAGTTTCSNEATVVF